MSLLRISTRLKRIKEFFNASRDCVCVCFNMTSEEVDVYLNNFFSYGVDGRSKMLAEAHFVLLSF